MRGETLFLVNKKRKRKLEEKILLMLKFYVRIRYIFEDIIMLCIPYSLDLFSGQNIRSTGASWSMFGCLLVLSSCRYSYLIMSTRFAMLQSPPIVPYGEESIMWISTHKGDKSVCIWGNPFEILVSYLQFAISFENVNQHTPESNHISFHSLISFYFILPILTTSKPLFHWNIIKIVVATSCHITFHWRVRCVTFCCLLI